MTPITSQARWVPAAGRSLASSSRGRRTRDKVLESAIVVFGERGFKASTVLDIANHAGTASGTVYQYFEDKNDLFRCLLQDLTDRLYQETRMPVDTNGRLVARESVLTYLRLYRDHASIFRAWWELLEPRTEFTESWHALHNRSVGQMVAVINDGKKRGAIRQSLNPEITAELIVAAFERPVYVKDVLGWSNEITDEGLAGLISQLLAEGFAAPI